MERTSYFSNINEYIYILEIKYALIFYAIFVRYKFHSKNNSARYYHNCAQAFLHKEPVFFVIF